jgi:hypothetical protein
VVHEHLVGQTLQLDKAGRREHLARHGRADAHPAQDLHLLGRARVPDRDLHEEAIALRLGQRVDALRFDRVLRGQHQERLGHREAVATDRDVMLGHGLEQRRLHLGRCAVDLVGQHEVGADGADLDVEALLRRPVDAGPDDVGRHEVRRELKAGEGAADNGRHRLHRERLGQARHALQQAVAAGEEAHHGPLDHAILPHDDPLDLEQGPLEEGRKRARGGGARRSGVRHVRHVIPPR